MAVALRDARRGDELAVAEVHVRSWQEAYRELMPAEFLAGLDPRDRAERYTFEGREGAPTTVVAVSVDDVGGEGEKGHPRLPSIARRRAPPRASSGS